VAKLSIVVEECDETLFWLEMLGDLGLVSREQLETLLIEGNQLLSIVVAARRTAEKSLQRVSRNRQSAIGNRQ